jgi:hypothetical protein
MEAGGRELELLAAWSRKRYPRLFARESLKSRSNRHNSTRLAVTRKELIRGLQRAF